MMNLIIDHNSTIRGCSNCYANHTWVPLGLVYIMNLWYKLYNDRIDINRTIYGTCMMKPFSAYCDIRVGYPLPPSPC